MAYPPGQGKSGQVLMDLWRKYLEQYAGHDGRIEDQMLVGCDCSVWSSPLLPRITSLEASWRQAGQEAMRKLLEMRGEGTARCPTELVKPVLIPGHTCPE